MKLTGDNMPKGEFAYKALFKDEGAWYVSEEYFFSEDEARELIDAAPHIIDYKWPVEMIADGVVYIPTKEELEGK